MTIEIAGAGFVNKGAELMLRTTIGRLRAQRPDIRLAVQPAARSAYEERARLELVSIFPTASIFPDGLRSLMLRSRWLESILTLPLRSVLPKSVDPLLGLVSRSDCEALVDISGYAFGDGFGWAKCLNAYSRSHAYFKRRKPIIYLPQMFGPFTHTKVRKYFKMCCDEATRIYARDRLSFDVVNEIVGNDDRLRLAPDITIFSSPDLPESDAQPESCYACLVPNQKMLEKGRDEWADSYLQRMHSAGVRIHSHHIHPVVVSHSAEDSDARLADQLAESLEATLGKGSVGRFSHEDPFQLKSFISNATFLVGSRYHSIVAALSTGVPAVLLGWAHKYDMLAEDFAVSELQHRGTNSREHLLELVDKLADCSLNESYRATIRVKRSEMRSEVDRMWEDIFSLLFGDRQTLH